jgi:hypothetical protein
MRGKSFRKKVSSAKVTPSYPRKGRHRGKKGCSCPRRRRPLSLGEPTVAQPPGEGPSAVNVCWSRCRQNAVTLVGGRSRPEARFAQVRQGVTITACSRRFGQKTRSRLPRFRGDALATSRRWCSILASGEGHAQTRRFRTARCCASPVMSTLRPLRARSDAALRPRSRRFRPRHDDELIALIWLVQRPSLSFEAALRRTRRIPPAAQPGYLMGIRLERYIDEGLRKLGCGGA